MGNLYFAAGSLFANRFEIEKPAGSGGMGIVYRARDRYTGERVALKLLHANIGEADAVDRFAREAQLLSEQHHPGIVAHVAHGQTPDGQRFLAMEWLDGEDLGQRLLRGPLPLRDCLRLLVQVAEALSRAHKHGVIHRDLKPTNLFLVGGEVERVKLLDFGIARRIATPNAESAELAALRRLSGITRTGMVVGTPEYMAPEQARGVRALTPAADVFSLGCVLYECLTGQPPFVADHLAAVLVRILFEEPSPIEQHRPGIPAAVVELVGRLLAKDPAQRPSDASVLRYELSALGELPEPALAITMVGPQPPKASFAENEQSLFSVVLAAPPEDAPDLEGRLSPFELLQGDERQELLQALQPLGVSADFLISGALVVTVPSIGTVTDQAIQAARAALLIKERWPVAVVSMATGRGAIRGRAAVGEVVDMAARALKPHSHPASAKLTSGILVDSLSAKLLEGRFAQTPQPEGALLLSEERDVDQSRPLLGKPTPCVGREAELANLEAQLTGCIEESEARAMIVTAPPGVGKSRLRHEFMRRVAKKGVAITQLVGRGDLMSAGAPYGMLRDAIHRLCGISGSEPLDAQRERLWVRVAQHVATAEKERIVLFIGELCNIPYPEEGRPMLQAARHEPKIMQERLRRALLDWLAAECAAAPVLLVLDDLQWGDALTVSVLDEVLRDQAGTPLFVLAFARPEIHETFPKLWQRNKHQGLELKRLSKKACERLIQQVLGMDVAAESLSRAVEQSAGNALFLEELIRSLAEGKVSEQPETVLAMLQARVGRLETGARRAVRAAAVYGQTFWRGGIAAILGLPTSDPDIETWLVALEDAELLQLHPTSRLTNEREYAFRHALVREAAYSLLTESDLATGHRRAGEFLEAAGEHDAAIVAEHFERSGERHRAAGWYLKAAIDGVSRGTILGALRHVDRGLLCEPDEALLAQLRSIESYLSLMLNRHDRMEVASGLALAQLRTGSLGWYRAIVPPLLAAVNHQDGARMSELISLLLASEPDADARAVYIDAVATIHMISVIVAPAPMLQTLLHKLSLIVAQAEKANPTVRRYLGMSHGFMAMFRDPAPWTLVQQCQLASELADQAGDGRVSAIVRGALMEWGWLDLGDADGARQRLAELESIMGPNQDQNTVCCWRYLRARAICAASDEHLWGQAEQLVAPMLAQVGGFVLYPILAQEMMARLALQRGRLQEAEAQSRALMQFFPFIPTWISNVVPVHIRALIGLEKAGEATEVAEQVLAVIPMLGGLGVAEVDFRLAASTAFHAAGDRERASTELRETLRQIHLRADGISDSVWKKSYLTRNPSCARAQLLAEQWGLVGQPH